MIMLETGDTGKAVSAESDGALYSAIIGSESYVLNVGKKFTAEIQSNNKIKINDGSALVNGRHVRIASGDSELITINNGSHGLNRKDIIVIRYQKEPTGIESVKFLVIQGEETSLEAKVPSYTKGNILTGSTVVDFPLYEVSLTGINITEVKKLFKVLGTNEDLDDKVTELNGKINNRKNNVLIGKWGSSWSLSTTAKNIGSSKPIVDDDCYKTTTGANATVTIKQSGLYCVTMYAQGAANQGASACIQAQVIADRTIIDDNYVLFGSQYSYNGFSVNVNMSRIICLENGTVLSPQIRKSDTSGASATTGSSYMEVVKLA